MFISISRSIFTIVIFLLSMSVYANDTELTRMLVDLKSKYASPELTQGAMEKGKQRALLCSQCHGTDGNSVKLDVPNLASQNSIYLLKQIEKFADGRRKNYVMNALSKKLSAEDKINLTIYYSNMVVERGKSNTNLAVKGELLYERKCGACHGDKGKGNIDYARLAGQKMQYVEKTLRRFRGNIKVSNKHGKKRQSFIMEEIAKNLSDVEIKALAAYVGQLY